MLRREPVTNGCRRVLERFNAEEDFKRVQETETARRELERERERARERERESRRERGRRLPRSNGGCWVFERFNAELKS